MSPTFRGLRSRGSAEGLRCRERSRLLGLRRSTQVLRSLLLGLKLAHADIRREVAQNVLKELLKSIRWEAEGQGAVFLSHTRTGSERWIRCQASQGCQPLGCNLSHEVFHDFVLGIALVDGLKKRDRLRRLRPGLVREPIRGERVPSNNSRPARLATVP